jgi:ribosome-binding protein aMBF1 (putative translation factor)
LNAGSIAERQFKVKHQNIVGAQIRKLRYNREWSQSKLAIQLQLKGLDVSREVIAQIEGQCHCVKDKDLPYFARVFQVGLTDLFPNLDPDKPIHDSMTRLMGINGASVPAKVVMKSLQPDSATLVKKG